MHWGGRPDWQGAHSRTSKLVSESWLGLSLACLRGWACPHLPLILLCGSSSLPSRPPCPANGRRRQASGPLLGPPAGLLQAGPPGQEVPKEEESRRGRMSAPGAGPSTGGDCDEAATRGPGTALGTEEGERPAALRQMWRYRSWDVPQIPAEVPQKQ